MELRTEGIDMTDSFDSKFGNLKTLAFENITRYNVDRNNINFKFLNFNNKEVKFTMLTEDDTILRETPDGGAIEYYNKPWVLILKCKGYTE
jgi:hypothetical protein